MTINDTFLRVPMTETIHHIGLLKPFDTHIPGPIAPRQEEGGVLYEATEVGSIHIHPENVRVTAAVRGDQAYLAEAQWQSLGRRKRRRMQLASGESTDFQSVGKPGDRITLFVRRIDRKRSRLDVVFGG